MGRKTKNTTFKPAKMTTDNNDSPQLSCIEIPLFDPPSKTDRRTFFWVLGGVLAFFVGISLYAGYFNGRSFWCDEILNLSWQKLSVHDLIQCEHNRQSSSQTTFSYLVQRPFVLLGGYEFGGILASTVAGVLLILGATLTARKILGARAGFLALLLTATSPLVLYFSSEWAFYIFWGAAAAWAFGLFCLWLYAPSLFGKRHKAFFALAVLGLAGFHFAGLFVWAALFAVGLVLLPLNTEKARRKKALLQFCLLMIIPVVLLVPNVIQAQKVQYLMGNKHIAFSHIGSAIYQAFLFPVHHFLSLSGGGYTLAGLLAFLLGIAVLVRRGRRACSLGVLSAAFAAAILPFICYVYLRGHYLNVTRYYMYAAAPVCFTMAAWFDWSLKRKQRIWVRCLSGVVLGVLILTNVVGLVVTARANDRAGSLRDFMTYLGGLSHSRTVVCANQYENRFFGGYYPIPNDGVMTAPCYWEEGEEKRAEGLKKIWDLVPDAILYSPNGNYDKEVTASGIAPPVKRTFLVSPLLRFAWKLRMAPERGYYNPAVFPKPATLSFRSLNDLAEQAERQGSCILVPSAGWKTIRYRSMEDGQVAFALLAVQGKSELQVYSVTNQLADVDLGLYPYTRTYVTLLDATGRVATGSLKPGEPRGVYIPQKKAFKGLVSPDLLVKAGIDFALALPREKFGLKKVPLKKGWQTFRLETSPVCPILLLSDRVAPASKR